MRSISRSVLRSFQSVRASGIVLGLVVGLVAVSVGAAQPGSVAEPAGAEVVASASQEADEAVVLPSRVSAAILRATGAVDRTEARIDDTGYAGALLSLKAIGADIGRANRAAVRQLNAVPPEDEEGGEVTPPGPDSVVAVLTAEQSAVTRLAGLFDAVTNVPVVNGLNSALTSAQATRDKLVNAVVGLDPEGAGVDYADVMADTVDGYADEVANLTEALQLDRLTPAGRAALNRALTRAKATQAKINAAFGGGE